MVCKGRRSSRGLFRPRISLNKRREEFIPPLKTKKSEKKVVYIFCFSLSLSLSLLCSTVDCFRYVIALERKQKETEKRKNEKTLDLKRDGCIPYGFKVYVDKTNDLIVCLNNFQTHLHSFQRACGDIEYTHTKGRVKEYTTRE